MYDESWYTSLEQKSDTQPRTYSQKSKIATRGRETIQEGKKQADSSPVDRLDRDLNNGIIPVSLSTATVARRAKSYSDFYDIVRGQMKKELRQEKRKRRQRNHYLANEVDFEGWYNGLQDELLDASHDEYRLYQDQLIQTESHLESVLESANSTFQLLSALSESFKTVEAQTTDFQARCEDILSDQKKTSKLAEELAGNLQYYNYLEPITRRLNAPGAGNFVRRTEFSEMLSNLDTCIDYMQAHPKQRESSTYAAKYRLLLTRALTLIRNHFTSSLRDIAADVSKRIADRQLNDTTMSALLYAKFRVGAPELKQIGEELQRRAVAPLGASPGTEGEYQGLMNELHQNYSTTRGKLLHPIIAKKIADIAAAPSTSKDLVAFARSCMSFIRGLSSDEYDLWGEWFNSDHMLYSFLESMCEPMYDHLRPRIVHEPKILKLCELCTLIQTRYMEESELESDSVSEEPKFDFFRLVQPALHDAQDRLVFLAQGIIRNEIQYFKPKPEDLDYPRRASRVALSGSRGNAPLSGQKGSNGLLSPVPKTPTVVEEDSGDRDFLYEPGTQEYYPTLAKAIWLLSRIYRLVHSTVFDSLAHEIVHHTTISLTSASGQISTRASPTDANLFLLSHLLALKHHILAFDIEFAESDVQVDFTSSLWDIRDSLLNPAKLVRALGGGFVPRVVTNMKDARTEVDERLRIVIGDLVSGWSQRMGTAISEDASKSNGEERRGRTDARKGATNDDAATVKKVRDAIQRDVPLIRRKLDEYVYDARTRDMLLRAVLEDVLIKYAAWMEKMGLASVGGKGRAKGKGKEDGVWEEAVFGEWAVGAFGLDAGGEHEADR